MVRATWWKGLCIEILLIWCVYARISRNIVWCAWMRAMRYVQPEDLPMRRCGSFHIQNTDSYQSSVEYRENFRRFLSKLNLIRFDLFARPDSVRVQCSLRADFLLFWLMTIHRNVGRTYKLLRTSCFHCITFFFFVRSKKQYY